MCKISNDAYCEKKRKFYSIQYLDKFGNIFYAMTVSLGI